MSDRPPAFAYPPSWAVLVALLTLFAAMIVLEGRRRTRLRRRRRRHIPPSA